MGHLHDDPGQNRQQPGGFTLIEVVIMVAILAILASVVVRTMMPRVNSAEGAALAGSLESIRVGVYNFRAHVGQYPAELLQLAVPPGTAVPGNGTASSLGQCGNTPALTAAQIALWGGPYIDQAVTANGTRSGSATISNTLTRESGETPAVLLRRGDLLVSVADVQPEIAALVEDLIDATASSTSAGMIRYTEPTLTYRIPVKGC